jgi:hypothetical protein
LAVREIKTAYNTSYKSLPGLVNEKYYLSNYVWSRGTVRQALNNTHMRLSIILTIVILLIGCSDKPVDTLTPGEIAQKLNGYWKLKTVETNDTVKEFDLNSDKIKYFDFEGTKGIDADLTDNHDGSFMTHTHDPFCEIKERDNKKIIEYFLLFNENWDLEIKSLSMDELVLADSTTTWTYIRHKME